MDIEVFSFFSGLGFLDLGFEAAGFNIVFVNDCEERVLYAYKYARRQFTHTPRYGYSHEDIRSYLSDELWQKTFPNYNNREKKIVGFIGGPPCPDFSRAGKNEGATGKNGQLTSAYVSLIIKRKPDFFVFENVKGLYQTKKHKEFYESIKRKFRRAGYKLCNSIENALEYGVPQYRDRLFLIGFKTKSFGKCMDFEIGMHKKYDLKQIMQLPWPTTSPFLSNTNLPCPSGIIEELTVEYWFKRNDVACHANALDIFGIKTYNKYQSIPEGATSGKSFKRLHRWRYSPTAAYGNNEVHLHPYKLRRISVAEALAIQSAPPYFGLPPDIPLSAKFKMVGNGVPVLLAYGIALDISDVLKPYKEHDYDRIL